MHAHAHNQLSALSFVPESYPAYLHEAARQVSPLVTSILLLQSDALQRCVRHRSFCLRDSPNPGLTPSALSSCETVSPCTLIRKPYVVIGTPSKCPK